MSSRWMNISLRTKMLLMISLAHFNNFTLKKRPLNYFIQMTYFKETDNQKKNLRLLLVTIRIYMAIATAVSALNLLLTPIAQVKASSSFACYVPKMVIHVSVDQSYLIWFSLLFSFLIVGWRFGAWHLRRAYGCRYLENTDLISFLISDPKLVERTINAETPSKQLARDSSAIRIEEEAADSEQTVELLDELIFRRSQTGEKHVRPNRSFEAYSQLAQLLDVYFRKAAFFTGFLLLLFVPSVVYTAFFAQHANFAGCANIQNTFSFWYLALSSTFLTLCIIVDCFSCLTLVPVLLLLLSKDMQLYWQVIENKLRTVCLELSIEQVEQEEKENLPEKNTKTSLVVLFPQINCQLVDSNLALSSHRLRSNTWHPNNRLEAPPLRHNSLRRGGYLDDLCDEAEPRKTYAKEQRIRRKRLSELQDLLADFFQCLERANKFISTVLSFIIFIWLSCNAAATLSGIQLLSAGIIIVRICQICGFVLLALASFVSLKVKRKVLPKYVVLNTLVSTETSKQAKERWLKVLDIFAPMKRYAFTLADGNILTELTFLRIVAFTVTLISFYEQIQRTKH